MEEAPHVDVTPSWSEHRPTLHASHTRLVVPAPPCQPSSHEQYTRFLLEVSSNAHGALSNNSEQIPFGLAPHEYFGTTPLICDGIGMFMKYTLGGATLEKMFPVSL